jgi:hypothetical protein
VNNVKRDYIGPTLKIVGNSLLHGRKFHVLKNSSGKVENVLLYRDKESSRDAVRLTIQDHLWSEQTGLPETYSEEDVRDKTEAVLVHVSRAYPTVPSPYYASMAS